MDRGLLYATGGVAISDADFESFRDDASGSVKFNNIGGVVGGGFEYAAWDNVSFRAQGLYYFFHDKKDMNDDKFPEAEDGDFGEFKDAVTVTGGISWYFR
jgi:opacity protein-like surface antigen